MNRKKMPLLLELATDNVNSLMDLQTKKMKRKEPRRKLHRKKAMITIQIIWMTQMMT